MNAVDRTIGAAAPGLEDRRAGVALEGRRLVIALKRRARTLAIAAALSAAAGAVVAKTVVKQEYEAQMVLQWEHQRAPVGEDQSRELQTLIDSVKLSSTIERVRERLGLTTTVDALAARVQVVSSGESNIITLKGTAPSAEAAAHLTSTVTDVFLEHRIDVERQRRSELVATTASDVDTAQKVVARTRKEYDDFCVEHGISDLPAETQAAIQKAARLRSEADMARAETEAEVARMKALRRVTEAERPTAVLSEVEVLPLTRKLAEAKADLVALKAQLAADHPRVQALEAQIAEISRRAAEGPKPAAAERTIGPNPQWETAAQGLLSAGAQRDAAQRRTEAYLELAGEAQEAITRLSKIGGAASARLASLHVAEKHLANLEEQLAKEKDDARSPTSDFRILAPARPPLYPSKAIRRWVILSSPLVGLLVSAAAVLLIAIRRLRVFTARELAFWGRAPVVASSTWPRDAGALSDLLEDLELSWRRSSGDTLVLPFGEAETKLASTLVEKLRERGVLGVTHVPAGLSVPALRRAARTARRVLVLVLSGQRSGLTLSAIEANLGRSDGLGFLLLGAFEELVELKDREGDVEGFWRTGDPSSGRDAVSM